MVEMGARMEQVGSRALIVEGGAMRGIFSCGVLDHFLAKNFSPFDSFGGYLQVQAIWQHTLPKCQEEIERFISITVCVKNSSHRAKSYEVAIS